MPNRRKLAALNRLKRLDPDDSLFMFRQFLRRPMEVAAIAPSSRFLAERMADSLALSEAQTVLELGPGTGSLTAAVMPRLRPGARFLAIEKSEDLLRRWQERFPTLEGVAGDVANLQSICESRGIAQVDCIVSGLPWPSFPPPLQDQAISAVAMLLKPGGQMATFGYHIGLIMPAQRHFRALLNKHFQRQERLPWEWRNLPPAFVLRATR
jgi:phosphatidylethanolamine/phosphatidyl-N-methylethanolamine N-methyltransferase